MQSILLCSVAIVGLKTGLQVLPNLEVLKKGRQGCTGVCVPMSRVAKIWG